MPIVILLICIIFIFLIIMLMLNIIKLKVNKVKSVLKNNVSEYESVDSIISDERIAKLKEKIKQTSEITINKSATKKDVEEFYKSQLEDSKKDTE